MVDIQALNVKFAGYPHILEHIEIIAKDLKENTSDGSAAAQLGQLERIEIETDQTFLAFIPGRRRRKRLSLEEFDEFLGAVHMGMKNVSEGKAAW